MHANPLLEQILSGENRQLQVLAAEGMVPLAPEDLVPIQVALTNSPDQEIAGKAAAALAQMEPRMAADYLADLGGARELDYFARAVDHPTILGAILRRKDTPRQIFVLMAPRLPSELQETLILRQDAILDEPEILVALETNPRLTNYAKRRIWEYREHLLPQDKVPPKSAEEIAAEADSFTEEDLREAVEEIIEKTGEGAEALEEEELDLSKLNAEQVRMLPVPLRLKVARKCSASIRAVLIRDKSAQIAMAVLDGNPIPDNEIEMIAGNKQVCEEVLGAIAKKREWNSKYGIVKALTKNPKTNPSVAVRFVPRMSVKDLKDLSKDKNVSEAVRQTSRRLYMQKRK